MTDSTTELTDDRQSLDQKYEDLFHQYQEKNKKHAQTQKLYDTLKQKVMVEKMEPAADNDVNQTMLSINAMAQAERLHQDHGSKHGFRPLAPPNLTERTMPRYGPVQEGLERLHPHQRSGSSAAGSATDQIRMMPPDRLRGSRIRELLPQMALFPLTISKHMCKAIPERPCNE